jgi:phospholipid N-methyltransferase
MDNKLKENLASFKGVWEGGYYEGNPSEPLTLSSYGELGYMSVLRATYLRCIKPYITGETCVLEIGAGRGAWTKTMLTAKEIWALDVLSPEENHFWQYMGEQPHVKYIQVNDFSCSQLPDDYFNYMFSFGCLCHVPFMGIEEYAKNLFPKLKSGSNCFWLVADYEKYNRIVADLPRYSIWGGVALMGRRYALLGKLFDLAAPYRPQPIAADIDEEPSAGRWFHAGINRTCEMLKTHGYKIIDSDVETSLRDPIIHFMKP